MHRARTRTRQSPSPLYFLCSNKNITLRWWSSLSLGYRVSIFTDFFQRLPTPKSRQSSRVFLIGGRCRRKEAQVYCPRAIWWPTANHLSLSLSLFFHTFYELIEPQRTRILSDASSLNSLIKYAGIIYSSLRFASFFSPFILFPLFDTFSLPLPSLAFLTQLGIGDAPPFPRAFIWNFNSQLITRRLFHRHRQDLDLIRIKQHFYPLFFLASLFLFIFIHFFPTEKWSELHFLRLTATSVEWERTTAGRERRKKRKSRVPARG